MADATNHTGYTEKLERAMEDLEGGREKLRQAAEAVSGPLRDMGLSGVAASLSLACQRADNVCTQGMEFAIWVIKLLNDHKCIRDLVDVLKKDFVPPLAAVDALVTELKGRNTLDWQGIGADAYKEHADVQRDAAGELSESANMVADVLLSDMKSAQELAGAIAIAIVAAIGGFAAGCAALPPPVTPAGVAVIVLAVVGLLTALVNCFVAYKKRQADIREGLGRLQGPPDGGKSKFGMGRWPERTLYS